MTPFQKFINDLVTKGFEYFGRYYGCYEGFVVENADPNNMSRVMVKVPEVSGDGKIGKWALPINIFSGPGYGSQVIPPKDSMVWVSFKYGNPKSPLYSHGYHGPNEKPDKLRKVDNYWFRTPKGNEVQFDDGEKKIIITQLDGTLINIEKDKISLNGNEVFLGNLNRASHPIGFGDKTAETSGDMAKYLGNIDRDMAVMAGMLATITGDPTCGGVISNIPQRLSTLPDLITTIEEIPSTKVKSE